MTHYSSVIPSSDHPVVIVWSPCGHCMVSLWLLYGHPVVNVWSLYGHHVVILLSLYGHPVVTVWSPCGKYMVTVWSLYGHHVVNVWSPCGHCMVTLWSLCTCVFQYQLQLAKDATVEQLKECVSHRTSVSPTDVSHPVTAVLLLHIDT